MATTVICCGSIAEVSGESNVIGSICAIACGISDGKRITRSGGGFWAKAHRGASARNNTRRAIEANQHRLARRPKLNIANAHRSNNKFPRPGPPLSSTGSHRDCISVARAWVKKNRASRAGARRRAESRCDAPGRGREHRRCQRSARRRSLITEPKCVMNRAAAAPSITRWSYESESGSIRRGTNPPSR
jgi:hypothetical protein